MGHWLDDSNIGRPIQVPSSGVSRDFPTLFFATDWGKDIAGTSKIHKYYGKMSLGYYPEAFYAFL